METESLEPIFGAGAELDFEALPSWTGDLEHAL